MEAKKKSIIRELCVSDHEIKRQDSLKVNFKTRKCRDSDNETVGGGMFVCYSDDQGSDRMNSGWYLPAGLLCRPRQKC